MPKLPSKPNEKTPLDGHLDADVTAVRVTILKPAKGTLLAMASITLNDAFVVSGFKVVNGSKGVFVSCPSEKGKDGEYHDTAFPLTKAGRDAVTRAVLAAYEKA